MFFGLFWGDWTILIVMPAMIFALWAQMNVTSTFEKYSKEITHSGRTGADAARALSDSIKSKYPDGVAVFATVCDGKLNFIAAAGSEAVKLGAHAGKIISEVSAICGGKGGGRPDSAMSGGRDIDKVDEALLRVESIVSSI